MRIDQQLWNDIDERANRGLVGAYRGIPYVIARDKFPAWDPSIINSLVVGVTLLISDDDKDSPSPIPDIEYNHTFKLAKHALKEKMDLLVSRLDEFKDNCKFYQKYHAVKRKNLDNNKQCVLIVEEYIKECFATKNVKKIRGLFELAEIPHINDTMSFKIGEGHALDTLLFRASGLEITPEIKEIYPEIAKRVKNFGNGVVWTTDTLFGGRAALCDEAAPTFDKNCEAANFIRTRIDDGLERWASVQEGWFKLELPVAENFVNTHQSREFNDVRFSAGKTFTVYCQTQGQVKHYKQSYPEGLVKVTEQENYQGPGGRY